MTDRPPLDPNPHNPETTVTITEQAQREQAEHPQPDAVEQRAAAARRDLAREHGNHVASLADLAEQQQAAIEAEQAKCARLAEGLQGVRFLASAPWTERTLEIDRLFHDGHGSLVPERISEFVTLLLSGRTALEARTAMVAGQRAGQAKSVRDAVAAARRVSAKLHGMAEVPQAQPALPPAAFVGEVLHETAGRLPRRERIAPSLPPMVPSAPPETAAESTAHLLLRTVEAELANGEDMQRSIAALQANGYAGPDMGPAAAPSFSATALPTARSGDTQQMPAAAADAPEKDGGKPSGSRPLADAASAAQESSPAVASESGEADES
jgi:hypothetical protein